MGKDNSDIAVKKEPFHLRKWLRKRKVQKVILIVTFSIIPLALLTVFTYLPFVKMVQFSFYKMKYIGPRKYVGFQNYIDVFQREDCFKALRLSIYYLVGALFQLVLALYFATILSFKVKLGGFFKGAMFFPYLVCGIAVGYIFQFFYTRGFVLDTILSWFGIPLEKLPYWLKDTKINNVSLAATSVWRYMGQNMVLFIGAIMSVDKELYEAAELDGANKWKQFKYIILPGIKTIVVLNLILAVTGSISAFEPCFVITKGTMGTGTYFYVMHKLAHNNYKVGLASAMAIILLVIILITAVLQKVIMNVLFEDGDDNNSKKIQKKLKKSKYNKEVA
ncbi:carbohydrate ABC transporter permease [[Clostridium] polysaccharolyticum]|uniref:Multiple sugar transport system permease protein n=1 Tax=[Clostridium] polysaccharolyticum TaxID=29364 RepID=A0A1I0F334_9FIRM|nr:sugar ABC transporter permease [[Clostridium] polysaccharolyticum]SET52420.1 multiple sugar transport system permease protein [[Clostridium] polysaccharolyticum]